MLTGFISQALTSFGAGILASLSPCIYPMLPITLGFFGAQSRSGRKREVLCFSLGQMVVFTILGIIAVTAGQALGMTADNPRVQLIVGTLLVIFGVFSLIPALANWLSRLQFSFGSSSAQGKGGLISALLLGMGSALLVSPCTTPILSGLLAMIATQETFAQGAALMAIYSAGMSLVILLLGLGALNLKRLPRSGNWLNYIHKLGGIALILAGLYYVYQSWVWA